MHTKTVNRNIRTKFIGYLLILQKQTNKLTSHAAGIR